jgi:hypothetical protein
MKKANALWLPPIILLLVLMMGCSKPYMITQELTAPFNRGASCSIGDIIDALPSDFEADKKPTAEDMEKFKEYLAEALMGKELFGETAIDLSKAEYEVTGSILDFAKGSGFLRFIFGWAGEAKVTVSLQLLEKSTKNIVFSGNFVGTVTSGWEEGDKMYEYVAENFAGKLNKELKDFEKKK